MIHKVQTYIETNHLLTFEKPVIVGFSGGGDSVSLLYILNRLGYKCIAAHCNFHLREEESDRDENFCQKFAEKHNIIFEKISFDTKSYAKKTHVSIEMAARDLRYNWFELIREKYNAQAIAVAHHRDDSNETMLLNMIRGTGIRGLSGIRPKNGYVVRPLLCVGRNDLIEYLKAKHLSYITDSSNLSDEYVRNFIRLRLIPLMEEVNPSVGTALARTAEHLADAEKIYVQTVENAKKSFIQKTDDNEFRISINEIMRQPAPRSILYEILRSFGFTRQISEEIFRILTGESGKVFNAPGSDFKLLKDRDYFIIYKQPEKTPEIYKIEENNTDCSNLPINISIHKIKVDSSFEIDRSSYTGTFDYDKINYPLLLRKWKSGDWFIPFGMKGRKKLSDYFSDHKFSIPEKNKTWLLCCGEDIIWIVGKRIDNRFRIDNDTKYALIINFSQKNSNI
ncbi:MAG: tRNA lysidine(34) synthetase TilS [Tannerella sp.]|nr:tRNA lysidine(34) synthetase TilS [Tannerella sp.]